MLKLHVYHGERIWSPLGRLRLVKTEYWTSRGRCGGRGLGTTIIGSVAVGKARKGPATCDRLCRTGLLVAAAGIRVTGMVRCLNLCHTIAHCLQAKLLEWVHVGRWH